MRKIVRDRIIEKFKGCCAYCGSTEKLEIDHIIPLSKGGRHDEVNFQALCRPCNRKKKNSLDVSRFFKIEKGKDYILVNPEFGSLTLTPYEFRSIITQQLRLLDD